MDNIKQKYKLELNQLINKLYYYMAPFVVMVLSVFIYSDIKILKDPVYSYGRIPSVVLFIFMFIVSHTKLKNNNKLVYYTNTLTAISFIFMGFYVLIHSFDTILYKTSISAFIVLIASSYFLARGFREIIIVYSLPLLLSILVIGIYVKPDFMELRELLSPTAIYLGIFAISIINEKSRYKQFYYKTCLNEEKEKTQSLYEETLVQNNLLAQQKEEILTITEQIKAKSDELSEKLGVITNLNHELDNKNKAITNSINYASRIQEAILSGSSKIKKLFVDSFVIYKPCDIVSGDFYWTKQNSNKKIIAVADCTGHGVPGAFMSILGYSLLNEIYHNDNNLPANIILNELKNKLLAILNQPDNPDIPADGMDIAICIIDTEKTSLEYAGAHMPLVIIHNNKINLLKGDIMPIGKYVNERPTFTNHLLQINNNDVIYMYSDGFQDQIGGNDNKRLQSKNFRETLLNVHNKPFDKQKNYLNSFFEQWKGTNNQYDDILVIGFKIDS